MPGTPPVETKDFCDEFAGLKFDVILSTAADGSVLATIKILEGRADFHALYWGDSLFRGPSAGFTGRDSNLNLNGDASRIDGDEIQWDGAIKLSSPGLGKAGAGKPTFLEAGESLTVTLSGVTSLDEVAYIGIRATSTSTPEGSIKAVDDGVCLPEPKDDDPKDDDPKDDDPKAEEPEAGQTADPKHAEAPETDEAAGCEDGQVTAQLGGTPPPEGPAPRETRLLPRVAAGHLEHRAALRPRRRRQGRLFGEDRRVPRTAGRLRP
jgi:hypothetical protein